MTTWLATLPAEVLAAAGRAACARRREMAREVLRDWAHAEVRRFAMAPIWRYLASRRPAAGYGVDRLRCPHATDEVCTCGS